jgi:hypothetical protein
VPFTPTGTLPPPDFIQFCIPTGVLSTYHYTIDCGLSVSSFST